MMNWLVRWWKKKHHTDSGMHHTYSGKDGNDFGRSYYSHQNDDTHHAAQNHCDTDSYTTDSDSSSCDSDSSSSSD